MSVIYVAARYTSDPLLQRMGRWLVRTDRLIVTRYHRSLLGIGIVPEPDLFFHQWATMAIILLCVIHIVMYIPSARRFLPNVLVAITVAGPLYFGLSADPMWRVPPYAWLAKIEVLAVIAILLWYAVRPSMVEMYSGIGAVLAHYWFWGWIMIGDSHWWGNNMSRFATFILLPLVTALVWGAYCKSMTNTVGAG